MDGNIFRGFEVVFWAAVICVPIAVLAVPVLVVVAFGWQALAWTLGVVGLVGVTVMVTLGLVGDG